MKIIGTGLSGFVGSRIVEVLQDKYEFENLSGRDGCNILDKEAIREKIISSSAPIVLHLAAKTNVDECEQDKKYDNDYKKGLVINSSKDGKSAWEVNVIGTRNVVEAAEESGKKILFISTDFVFDGEKSVQEGYIEEDTPSPINWYGYTKYEGEKIVSAYSKQWIIARIAYPYRDQFKKNGFIQAIFERLRNNKEVYAITDHVTTPTYIDEIALALDILIQKNCNGFFHVVGSQFLTPHDIALIIAEKFRLDASLIKRTTRVEYFKNGAPRPFQLAIRNDKIKTLNIRMSTFEEVFNRLEL